MYMYVEYGIVPYSQDLRHIPPPLFKAKSEIFTYDDTRVMIDTDPSTMMIQSTDMHTEITMTAALSAGGVRGLVRGTVSPPLPLQKIPITFG